MENEDRNLNPGTEGFSQVSSPSQASGTSPGQASGADTGITPGAKKRSHKRRTAAQAAGSNEPGEEGQTHQAEPILVNTQEVVKQTKRKHKKKTLPKADIKELTDNLASFIQGTFAMVAARAGDYWNVSNDEAMKVAAPAARILDRLDLGGKASAYSDYMALIIALFTIIGPRLFMMQMVQKPERQVQLVRLDGKGSDDRSSKPSNGKDETSPAGNNDFADVIGQIIGS